MAIAHLYGLKTEPRDAPRAPRMSVDPTDFAMIADLARSIAQCQTACIRLHEETTGEVRLACFPPRPEIRDLPETLLPDGCSNTRVTQTNPSLQDEMRAAGMPDLAFWAGFALKSHSGRVIGVLGLMDEAPRDLTEGMIQQLSQLAAVLSVGIGLAETVVQVLARQTLGVIADVAEIDEGAASPALLGLLRYASGVLPSNAEAMALRIAGLADLKGGMLLLTPPAKAILFTHGFQLRDPLGMAMEAEVVAEDTVSTAFVAMARLRIGEVHHDIARCEATDQMAFRITGAGGDWAVLENGLEEGWPEIAAEIIKRTRNATLDYVRMHMIHTRDADLPEGEFRYDLYGMEWMVRGTPEHAEMRTPTTDWVRFDASGVRADAPRDFSAVAALAGIADIEARIGQDVHDWSKRIAAGAEITPIFA